MGCYGCGSVCDEEVFVRRGGSEGDVVSRVELGRVFGSSFEVLEGG